MQSGNVGFGFLEEFAAVIVGMEKSGALQKLIRWLAKAEITASITKVKPLANVSKMVDVLNVNTAVRLAGKGGTFGTASKTGRGILTFFEAQKKNLS